MRLHISLLLELLLLFLYSLQIFNPGIEIVNDIYGDDTDNSDTKHLFHLLIISSK